MSNFPAQPDSSLDNLVDVLTTVELRAAVAEGTGPSEASYAARRALRRMASGITILTLSRNRVHHGATVSAVLPISRFPLILGACLRTLSVLSEMLTEQPLFSVNVLGAGQQSIANHFADQARPSGNAQFAGLRCATDQITGAPVIGGCVAHLSCRAIDRLSVGDHVLILADVIDGAAHAGAPLVSYAGRIQ